MGKARSTDNSANQEHCPFFPINLPNYFSHSLMQFQCPRDPSSDHQVVFSSCQATANYSSTKFEEKPSTFTIGHPFGAKDTFLTCMESAFLLAKPISSSQSKGRKSPLFLQKHEWPFLPVNSLGIKCEES